MEQIESLPGFKAENPLTKTNYLRLLGDYDFVAQQRCCYQKENGNLCNHEHQYGFVAQLKDGSATIIGNCCGVDKFDAGTQFRRDRNAVRKASKRRERLSALNGLLAERAVHEAEFKKLHSQLSDVISYADSIRAGIGEASAGVLETMAYRRSAAIAINTVHVRAGKDANGKEIQERTTVSHTLGHLRGAEIFVRSQFDRLFTAMRKILRAYASAQALTADAKTKEIEDAVTELRAHDGIRRDAEALLKAKEAFSRNDFTLFCFLTENSGERYKIARFVLDAKGEYASKQRAKDWVIALDKEIKERYGADSLKIAA